MEKITHYACKILEESKPEAINETSELLVSLKTLRADNFHVVGSKIIKKIQTIMDIFSKNDLTHYKNECFYNCYPDIDNKYLVYLIFNYLIDFIHSNDIFFQSSTEIWSPEGDELDILLVLVEAYETRHHQLPASDPVDAILFLMDQQQLKRKDLEPYLGARSRVADVLNRKRHLTLPQIVKLHKGLHIPYESLIEEKSYLIN